MGDLFLTDLADVCRTTGYPVVEVDGWQSRARGSGGFNPGAPSHGMCHHTASGPSSDGWPDVNYLCFGDDDAPLSNLYLARDGTIYVCAAGGTNTNGSGQDPCGYIADDTMNSQAIGIEAGNDGVGEPWPEVQQDVYVALCSALSEAYAIPPARFHGHFEWTTRKVDPAGPSRWASSGTWVMDGFRDDIGHRPEPAPAPDEEDDMKALLVQASDGPSAGALAVAPPDLSRLFFLSTGADYHALVATGQYETVVLSGATFSRIPGAEQVDVVD